MVVLNLSSQSVNRVKHIVHAPVVNTFSKTSNTIVQRYFQTIIFAQDSQFTEKYYKIFIAFRRALLSQTILVTGKLTLHAQFAHASSYTNYAKHSPFIIACTIDFTCIHVHCTCIHVKSLHGLTIKNMIAKSSQRCLRYCSSPIFGAICRIIKQHYFSIQNLAFINVCDIYRLAK